MLSLSSRHRFALLLLACLLAGLYALQGMGLVEYVHTWVGSVFRAASGVGAGWLIGRYVLRIDLSHMEAAQRPLAGLSVAILMAGMAIAVAIGV